MKHHADCLFHFRTGRCWEINHLLCLGPITGEKRIISGDDISHIPVNGRGLPWLCQETLQLTWENIRSIAKNLLNYGFDVVIDYIIFPANVDWLAEQLKEEFNPDIKYAVLMADEHTLQRRDQLWPEEHRMGERCAVLLKEFEESSIPERHLIESSQYEETAIPQLAEEIKRTVEADVVQ